MTDAHEDMVKAGVIDPTKVLRNALQNAASISPLLFTTEATVPERASPSPGSETGFWSHE